MVPTKKQWNGKKIIIKNLRLARRNLIVIKKILAKLQIGKRLRAVRAVARWLLSGGNIPRMIIPGNRLDPNPIGHGTPRGNCAPNLDPLKVQNWLQKNPKPAK